MIEDTSKIMYPNINECPDVIDVNNWRITRIILWLEFLKKERNNQASLRKRYGKIQTLLQTSEVVLGGLEAGFAIAGILSTPILPVAGVFFTTGVILKAIECKLKKKYIRHYDKTKLAEHSLNSIESNFSKSLEDSKITLEEYNIIHSFIQQYESGCDKGEVENKQEKTQEDLLKEIKMLTNQILNNKKNV